MTLTQLRYLVAIADSGLNITQAAERVHATQPGLSKQLKQLEDELGFQLFTRKGRSLESVAPAGVRVINVFPGPIDDEWNQLQPPPKVAPWRAATTGLPHASMASHTSGNEGACGGRLNSRMSASSEMGWAGSGGWRYSRSSVDIRCSCPGRSSPNRWISPDTTRTVNAPREKPKR